MNVTPSPHTSRTAAERRARNRAIAARRAEGVSWAAIGREFGVSTRTAQRADRNAQRLAAEEVGALDQVAPLPILAKIIVVQTEALDCAHSLLATADNSSAKVGAIRACGSIGEALRSALVGAGLLPNRVEFSAGDAIRLENEAHAVARRLASAAERSGLDPNSILSAVHGDAQVPVLAGEAGA